MVVRRRGALMALVAVAALAVAAGYLWRFGQQHEGGGGVVPFLLGGALLAVSLVHVIAWRGAREPLLVVDLTGLRVRLGGQWTGLPWGEIASVEVSAGRRWGDGRVTVRPRDERRSLAEVGRRARLAVFLNLWLYDAALVVPYGLTTTESTSDMAGTLSRLADGRVPVVAGEAPAAEPEPTVEVAARSARQRTGDPDSATPGGSTQAPTRPMCASPAVREASSVSAPSGPRRLAAVVSALRSVPGRRGEVSAPVSREPATVGTLALADRFDEPTESLPELRELRRQTPEEAEAERQGAAADPDSAGPASTEADRPHRTANVELIIDATTDLSALAMRRVRRRPALSTDEPDLAAVESMAPSVISTSTTLDAPPNEIIGIQLRRARDWLAMSVDDLAERTRIRPSVIESIERGDFSPCGGDFYARGHLRMLAGVLGLDPAPIVSSYDEHLASAPVSPRAVFDAELSSGVLRPTGGGGSRWGALVGAVLVLLLVWGVARFLLSGPAPDPSSLTTPISQGPATQGGGLGSPGIGDIVVPPRPVAPTRATLSVDAGAPATSRVVVWDRSMTIVFQGVLHAGESKVVRGPGPLRVMAVDAGVVSLSAPGHPRATLGAPGQRVFRHVR